jgi:hypothetical protein
MAYKLGPMVEGTEGRVRGFKIVGHRDDIFVGVSWKTFSYKKNSDGSFKRLPEEWMGEDSDFGNFADAMSFVLNGWFRNPGLFHPGDTISCDLENDFYRWVVRDDGSFHLCFQESFQG